MINKETLIAKIQEIFPEDKYIVLTADGDVKNVFSQEKIKTEILALMNSEEDRFVDKALLFGAIAEDSSECLAFTDNYLFVFHDDIADTGNTIRSVIPYTDIRDISSSKTNDSFNMVIYTKDDYIERQATCKSVIKELSGKGIAITDKRFFSAGIISRICGLLRFVLDAKVRS